MGVLIRIFIGVATSTKESGQAFGAFGLIVDKDDDIILRQAEISGFGDNALSNALASAKKRAVFLFLGVVPEFSATATKLAEEALRAGGVEPDKIPEKTEGIIPWGMHFVQSP